MGQWDMGMKSREDREQRKTENRNDILYQAYNN